MEIKSIRLGNPHQVQSEEDFDKGEFWGLTTDNQEIRLYFFDEDLPVPDGYEEISFLGVSVFPVAFFRKIAE